MPNIEVKNTDNQKPDIGSVAPSGAGHLETGEVFRIVLVWSLKLRAVVMERITLLLCLRSV